MPESPDTFVPDVDEAETLTDNAFLAQIYSYRGTRSLFLSSCADLLLNSKNEASEEGVPGWSWLAPGGTLKRLDIQLSMYLSIQIQTNISIYLDRLVDTYLHIYIFTSRHRYLHTYMHRQMERQILFLDRQIDTADIQVSRQAEKSYLSRSIQLNVSLQLFAFNHRPLCLIPASLLPFMKGTGTRCG